jgi:hypothetical protein
MSSISAGTATGNSLVRTADLTGNLVLIAAGGVVDAGGGVTNTGALRIPVGNTAQRPTTATAGMIRFNTTLAATEFYNGTTWISI